jgi:hypothetical protein
MKNGDEEITVRCRICAHSCLIDDPGMSDARQGVNKHTM